MNLSMPQGCGLGLRRELLPALMQETPSQIDFFEIAPENWIPFGGALAKQLHQLTEANPFVCHGLSLSIASPDPLDVGFVREVKRFLNSHQISVYSEHLSFCSSEGHLYDLMPVPFTEEAIHYVSARIRQVQDILERPLVLENISYYASLGGELTELEFIQAIIAESGCQLLLDVNNIYVNACNHGYDAAEFLKALPSAAICYGHVAGHYQEAEDLIVDSHGSSVIDPVWQLLELAYQYHGCFPTLLEREFNIPPLSDLLAEVVQIKRCQQRQQAIAC